MPFRRFYRKRKTSRRPRRARRVKRSVGSKSTARAINQILSKEASPLTNSAMVDTQAGSGIPKFVKVRQNYFERVLIGDGILAPDSHVWSLSSTFDPNQTGGGTQPKGRDFYAGIYNNYTVLGAHYKVQFLSARTSKTLVGCFISTDPAIGTTLDSQKELMETSSRWNQKRLLDESDNGTRHEMSSISGYVPLSKFMLQTAGSFSDQFTVGVGSDPTTNVNLHCWAIDEAGSAIGSNTICVRIMIKYDVVYSGVVSATSS